MSTQAPSAVVYSFSGRIHPERAELTFQLGSPLEVQAPSLDWFGSARISIAASQVSLQFTGGEVADVDTLRNVGKQLVQTLIDSLGYSWCRLYEVELSMLTMSDGTHIVWGIEDSVLRGAIGESRPVSIERLLALTLSSPPLSRALRDLRGALQEPHDTGFYCYRAMESLRHHFNGTATTSAQWKEMRGFLNVSEETLKQLKHFADPRRHGGPVEITYAERLKDMSTAWGVVDRFISFLDGDEQPLQPETYPLL